LEWSHLRIKKNLKKKQNLKNIFKKKAKSKKKRRKGISNFKINKNK